MSTGRRQESRGSPGENSGVGTIANMDMERRGLWNNLGKCQQPEK